MSVLDWRKWLKTENIASSLQANKAIVTSCYLGIWFNHCLKFDDHVAHAVSKANQILGLIRRTFTYMDCQLMKQLFTSLVRPHLEFGNVVWYPYLQQEIDMIEAVQHRATRMVPGLRKLTYEDRLKKMDLPTLEYRRMRGDAIEAYKYLHGKYRVDESAILPRHTTKGIETRGHSLKLQKRESKIQLRSNYFGYRIVNMWNYLPEEIVSSSSVNCFKGRYDRWNMGAMFSRQKDVMEQQRASAAALWVMIFLWNCKLPVKMAAVVVSNIEWKVTFKGSIRTELDLEFRELIYLSPSFGISCIVARTTNSLLTLVPTHVKKATRLGIAKSRGDS